MQLVSDAEQQQVSGGCSPDCVPVDRRPVGPINRSFDPTDLGNTVPGGWTIPPPQAGWPYFSAQ